MASKASKNALVQRFCNVTNAPQAEAQTYLRAYGYKLEPAVDAFLNETADDADGVRLTPQMEKNARARLSALFDKYKDEDAEEDVINTEGALAMFEELGIAPESVVVIPLSYYLDSPSLGHFLRDKYVEGWLRLGVGAPPEGGSLTEEQLVQQQKDTIPSLFNAFKQDAPVRAARGAPRGAPAKGLYTSCYEFTFAFARSEGQKSLPLEVALTFWDLVLPYAPSYDETGARAGTGAPSFSARQYALWKQFLTEASGARIVTRDTWTQFLEFTREIDPAFERHDFDAAWPSVIDDFVAWAREQ